MCAANRSPANIKERKALDEDGWFPTRDAGWIDAEGYLFLAGRADDVIVRGGENMSPGEIEDVLMTHPAIADAAAVGVPSVEWGEAVGIAVVAKPGRDAAERRRAARADQESPALLARTRAHRETGCAALQRNGQAAATRGSRAVPQLSAIEHA